MEPKVWGFGFRVKVSGVRGSCTDLDEGVGAKGGHAPVAGDAVITQRLVAVVAPEEPRARGGVRVWLHVRGLKPGRGRVEERW